MTKGYLCLCSEFADTPILSLVLILKLLVFGEAVYWIALMFYASFSFPQGNVISGIFNFITCSNSMRWFAFMVIDAVGYGMEYLRSRSSRGLCFTTEAVLI